MESHFPVFLREVNDPGGEMTLFRSHLDMEDYLEAIDVENEEFEAWDVNGERLRLEVVKKSDHWLKIERTGIADMSGLRSAVHKYAQTSGVPASELDTLSPVEAVERIDQHEESRRRKRRWYQFWRPG